MNRQEILEEAAKAVTTERQSAYGTPENSFSGIADYWNVYMAQRAEGPFTAHDVGMMLLLMKVRRTAVSPGKADNYVDLAGYGACVGEISTGEAANWSEEWDSTAAVRQAADGFAAFVNDDKFDNAFTETMSNIAEVLDEPSEPAESRITGNPVHDALLKQMGGLVEAPSDVIAEAAQWAAGQAASPQGNYTDEEWAKEIRAQKAFEDHGLGRASEWVMFGDKPEQAYARFLADPYPIPAPPSGREWHNPRGLNAFQIGIAEGWRLCLKDEQSHECEAYVGGHLMWESRTFSGGADYGYFLGTYRTKAPIVAAKPKTPDIPPRQTKDEYGDFLDEPSEPDEKPLTPEGFPDPPPGRKWHNPEGLTAEQVGIADGWRLYLEDEVFFGDCEKTYRTKAPLP